MTAAEWEICLTKPVAMFNRVQRHLSRRKKLLLTCAFCRLLPQELLQPWAIQVIQAASQLADSEISSKAFVDVVRLEELTPLLQGYMQDYSLSVSKTAYSTVICCSGAFDNATLPRTFWSNFSELCHRGNATDGGGQGKAKAAIQCHWIRDITVHPHSPVPIVNVSGSSNNIAFGIYHESDFDRLPILADALEDDGFADERVLAHLRNGQEHVRGCWALDLILGKS